VRIERGFNSKWSVSFPPYLSAYRCDSMCEVETAIEDHLDLIDELEEST